MSSNEISLGVSLPLDSDGFLRRECPTCDREFKWLHSVEGEQETVPVPSGGYFCPYCGVQAPSNAWFTQEQSSLITNTVTTDAVDPMIKKFGNQINDIARRSRGAMNANIRFTPTEKLDPLTEINDMTRIIFECHPSEPIKVLDDWNEQIHCLICGEPKQ
jgi:hypothetical protein